MLTHWIEGLETELVHVYDLAESSSLQLVTLTWLNSNQLQRSSNCYNSLLLHLSSLQWPSRYPFLAGNPTSLVHLGRGTIHHPQHHQRTDHHVVASLAPEYAMEVRDLLLVPRNPYSMLNAHLIQCTANSKQRCIQQLLTTEELADRKPSQLLCRMQQLLGNAAGPNPGNSYKCCFYNACQTRSKLY